MPRRREPITLEQRHEKRRAMRLMAVAGIRQCVEDARANLHAGLIEDALEQLDLIDAELHLLAGEPD